jgi:hypothetical protein
MMQVEDLCRNLREGAIRAEAAGQSRIAEALRAVAEALLRESTSSIMIMEPTGRAMPVLEAV